MRKRLIAVLIAVPLLGGCSALMSALGGVTPDEFQQKTGDIRREIEEVRVLLHEVQTSDAIPAPVKEKVAALSARVDEWTGRLNDLAPKVDRIAENVAKVLTTGAGVATSIPGGQPVGAGMALLGQIALLIAAGVKGASKGGGP